MNREKIKGAVEYYTQMSAKLIDITEQINDSVSDKGMLEPVICEIRKFLWTELKEFMGNQWEEHFRKGVKS